MATPARLLPVLAALLVGAPALAGAQCSSATCTDLNAIENVRAVVAAACDCPGAKSHGQYVKCAKQVVRSAVRDGTLQKTCKGPVVRCEAQSTCGKKKTSICCVTSPKGKVKAKVVRGATCPGNLCDHPMSLVDACTSTGACTKRQGIRSFKSVQRVLQTSCALPSCHSTFARQGGLVLETEDVSYKSLVNHPAEHPQATGLLRVKPGDAADSFLIRKLRGQGPGDPMPQSGEPLADPIVKMIEDWIDRGALSTAEECKAPAPGAESLCDDSENVGGDYHWEPLPPLDPPAPTEGIQLHIPQRPVDPGKEWETCYAFRPGRDMIDTTEGQRVLSWTDVAALLGQAPGTLPAIRQQVYRMHPGSHHLLLYAYFGAHPEVYPQGYFPCVAANCTNDADCPPDAGQFTLPIGGTQVAGTRYEVDYPTGVGIPVLGENSVLIVNPHFTNPFQPAQETYGEAWLNLYFYKPGELKTILDGIFAINFGDLFVEPYQTRTISRIWQPRSILTKQPADAAVFQLFGHMHKRGTEFQIDYVRGGHCSVNTGRLCGRDGDCPAGQTCVRAADAEDTTIYYTTEWDQAPIVDFPKPYFPVNQDQGLRWTCTHTNGIQGDPAHPPKKCGEGCSACGWDPSTRTCVFTRGVDLGFDAQPRIYNEGDPMPLVFGQLADDDMCNMFGYFINQADLSKLP